MRAAIFVVDDQIEVAETTAALLESWGHEVTVETSGKRALEILLLPVEFDATFLDILMPDMTGGEIYNELKKHAPARLRRLCFMTGMGLLVDRWLASTGLPVIEKGDPSVPEKLAKIVQQYAALTCTKGPGPDPSKEGPAKEDKSTESTARSRIREKTSSTLERPPSMPSAHDLRKLLSQEADDDDEDDDTGIFIEKLERHSSSTRGGSSSASSGGSSDMTYAVVEYIHRKHGRLAKRVVAIEKRIDKAQWTIIAACSTGTLLVTVLYKLFESFVLKK